LDNRPVIKIEEKDSDFYWFCPECKARNEEVIVPGTPDLTCQACGANYKNGGSAIDIDLDLEFNRIKLSRRENRDRWEVLRDECPLRRLAPAKAASITIRCAVDGGEIPTHYCIYNVCPKV